MKHRDDEKLAKDPVCGTEISRKNAPEELAYHGKTYYFCAETCHEAFEADPEDFIPHHRQHGMQQS